MKKMFIILGLAIVLASCTTPNSPVLKYDEKDFSEVPKVVITEDERAITYRLTDIPQGTEPIITAEVVGSEIHCYAYMYISANHKTHSPRKIPIPNEGNVYWINPDGTKIELQ